jgi:hypothetical protein
MPQLADFGGLYYELASKLLAYRALTAPICQRLLPQPLHEVPTLDNGLDAEL